jgi:DNA-binding transcriptional MerR regulator
MLTISQLADYAGVTVRAVRHYHQRGLLAEPERDASGYRRYGAGAVIELIRIKALAGAGVPLARVEEVLAAGPDEFARSVGQIDQALAARIDELQEQRRRIAALAAGDRLFVPAEIADLLERIRGLGISPRAMSIERDSWILMAARYPERARGWARDKLADLADPELQQLYRAWDEAFGWAADDPRLDQLADTLLDFTQRRRAGRDRDHMDLAPAPDGSPADDPAGDQVAMDLLLSRAADMPPSWKRLDELCRDKAQARGLTPAAVPAEPRQAPPPPDRRLPTAGSWRSAPARDRSDGRWRRPGPPGRDALA